MIAKETIREIQPAGLVALGSHRSKRADTCI